MSEVLARIRVRETHGIRRFLYPLTAYVSLPAGTDTSSLQLAPLDGAPVPLQVTLWHTGQYRVDFAVSMAPLQQDRDYMMAPVKQDTDYLLTVGTPVAVPDPMQLTYEDGDKLSSIQERFQITLGPMSAIHEVFYDGVSHLTKPEYRSECPASFVRPNPEDWHYKRGLRTLEEAQPLSFEVVDSVVGGGRLSAWYYNRGAYADGSQAEFGAEITACKSWVMVNYRIEQPRPGEVIFFGLPLGDSISSTPSKPTTFDCGIDGIYGSVDYFGAFLNWFAPTETDEPIRWEIGKAHVYENGENLSPVNHTGTTNEEEFLKQRWFHLVSEKQSIAVAITKIPLQWKSLKISIRQFFGIRCELLDTNSGPAEFGVCYHFLNNVPAIAAATNPQSILLPPVVEVLPIT